MRHLTPPPPPPPHPDTAYGGAPVSLVDRASRYTLLERVGRKTAAAVGRP